MVVWWSFCILAKDVIGYLQEYHSDILFLYKNNRMSFCSEVLANRITDKVSVVTKLLIGPRKVYNYLWGGFLHPPKINRP